MIFYFSCTGNTRWAAQEVAHATGEELVDMAKAENLSHEWHPTDGERIGFCFPVHGWRPPLPVLRFIERMRLNVAHDTFCYCVCTAGDNIGETVDILSKHLAKRGITLHSAFSILMPESYVGLPFMDVDTPENEKRKKRQAATELQQYIKNIIKREKGVFKLIKGHWPRTNSRLIGSLFIKYLLTDKPFRVDNDKCLSCGKCADVCPIGNIQLDKDKHPIWQHNGSCISCFACYHHCPAHSIEYGRRTKGKGQYFFKHNN